MLKISTPSIEGRAPLFQLTSHKLRPKCVATGGAVLSVRTSGDPSPRPRIGALILRDWVDYAKIEPSLMGLPNDLKDQIIDKLSNTADGTSAYAALRGRTNLSMVCREFHGLVDQAQKLQNFCEKLGSIDSCAGSAPADAGHRIGELIKTATQSNNRFDRSKALRRLCLLMPRLDPGQRSLIIGEALRLGTSVCDVTVLKSPSLYERPKLMPEAEVLCGLGVAMPYLSVDQCSKVVAALRRFDDPRDQCAALRGVGAGLRYLMPSERDEVFAVAMRIPVQTVNRAEAILGMLAGWGSLSDAQHHQVLHAAKVA